MATTKSRSSMLHYYYSGCDENQEPHFLDACQLCSKPLGLNSDIFMYRGNTPFCSRECRQEQIDVDDAKEKSWRVSSSSLRKSDQRTKNMRTGGSISVA